MQAAYGELKVKKKHMMVATYGMVKPDHAVIMTHSHTFDGRYRHLLHTFLTACMCLVMMCIPSIS